MAARGTSGAQHRVCALRGTDAGAGAARRRQGTPAGRQRGASVAHLMARATSAIASSLLMSSLNPASNTAMAFRLPDPMVAKGSESVEPCG